MSRAARPRALVLVALPVVVAAGVLPAGQASAVAPSRPASSSAWFQDPLSVTQRAMLLPVPEHPRSVHGKPQQTRALWKSHGGAVAVPAIVAVGHQLEQGQAVTLSRRNLFAPGSARPTMATRARATALAVSLSRVTAVTCEGYTDFGGDAAREGRLAERRAAMICSLLAAARPGLDTTTHGFGRQVPVVVGGRPAQRAANRRVVVVATEGLPATPPSTNPPSTDPPQQASAPDAPALSSASGGTNLATLTFAAPASDGGSAVTGYEWSTDQTTWTPLTTTGSSPYTVQLGSLLAGSATYYVRAVNAVGSSPASTGSPATVTDPVTVPGAPTLASVDASGHWAHLSFTAPSDEGASPITGYQWSTDGSTWSALDPAGTSSLTAWVSSLPAGTATYRVRAVNGDGGGPASNSVAATISSATVPVAPSWVGAEAYCMGSTMLSSQINSNPDDPSATTGVQYSVDNGRTWVDPPQTELVAGIQWRFSLPGSAPACSTQMSLAVRYTSANGLGAASSFVLVDQEDD